MNIRIPTTAALLAAGAATLALACGGDDTAEKLAEAKERVRGVEAQVEAARRGVEREEAELERAREELERAREKLAAAEERLSEAQEQVAEVADDAYVFRAVQSALLEDPELQGVAILARVSDGVVVLEGRVSARDQRERAGEVAADIAGVTKIDNRITVAGKQET